MCQLDEWISSSLRSFFRETDLEEGVCLVAEVRPELDVSFGRVLHRPDPGQLVADSWLRVPEVQSVGHTQLKCIKVIIFSLYSGNCY